MIAAFVFAMIAVVVSAGFIGAASVLRDLGAAVFFSCTLTLAIVLAAFIYGAAVAT